MYVMFYVLPIYNMVNSTSLMEKIHREDRVPDAFAIVCDKFYNIRWWGGGGGGVFKMKLTKRYM
jgi:hypothetical protein